MKDAGNKQEALLLKTILNNIIKFSFNRPEYHHLLENLYFS
jgi:hypothetical protein